jgi:WD40 repeat protein
MSEPPIPPIPPEEYLLGWMSGTDFRGLKYNETSFYDLQVANLFVNNVAAVSFDDTLSYIAANRTSTTRLRVFNYPSISPVTPETILAGGTPGTVQFLKTTTNIIAATQDTPYISLFSFDPVAGTLVKGPNPATLPPAVLHADIDQFSDGSAFIAVHGAGTTPRVTIYDVVGNTFTRRPLQSNHTSVLGLTSYTSVAICPQDEYVVFGRAAGPEFLRLTKVNGTELDLIANAFDVQPASGQVRGVRWSPDRNYLIISKSVTPFIDVYSFDPLTELFTKLPDVDVPVSANPQKDWNVSNDSKYVAVRNNAAQNWFVYDLTPSGLVFKSASATASFPSGGNSTHPLFRKIGGV